MVTPPVDRGGSITTRLIVPLTLCLAAILGAGMLLDYRLSREQILERVALESSDSIEKVITDLENLLDGVEGSTVFLGRILQQRDYSLEGLQQMLKDIVEGNEDIFGATIALNPELVDEPLGFAPYYYRKQGIPTYVNLARHSVNYQDQDWFLDAVDAGKPIWVEPYFDIGGARELMTTFSVPVIRSDAEGNSYVYAVVTADITLQELSHYLENLNLGDSGFGVLFSRSGIILSSADPDDVMRHFSEAVDTPGAEIVLEQMFEASLGGHLVKRSTRCEDISGPCIIRLGRLLTTGWPVAIVYSENELLAPLRAFQVKAATLGAVTLVLAALAVSLVTRRLTRPLAALAAASDEIARGNLNAGLPSVRGQDEVARLVAAFGTMKRDLKTYISDLEQATARSSRLEGEMAAAREIQMSMLPQGGQASEQFGPYNLWARVRPARSVGGDLYTYHQSGRQLLLAVGDVSDKGVPAALFMARAISQLNSLQPPYGNLGAAMARLNDRLVEGNDNCMFVTLFLGVLDLDSGALHCCSAGHTPPLLRRGDATAAQPLRDGPPLGLSPGLEFPENELQLEAGDLLAVYTDGIDEAFDGAGAMFGHQRMAEQLRAGSDLTPEQLGMGVFDAVDRFAAGAPQSDDITLLLLQAGHPGRFSRQLTRGPGLLGETLDWLQRQLEGAGITPPLLGELTLVTEEVVTNVDKYAGLAEGAGITLAATVEPGEVTLEFSDEGSAFNPLEDAERATLGEPVPSAEVGGLGVHLFTQLTDRQEYLRRDGRNVLRLIRARD